MTISIPYERNRGPWFGPKQRARAVLTSRTILLSPKKAIEVIATIIGPLSINIQRIRFIDYVHRGSTDFRYTIAVVWTYSDYDLRQALYERAEDIVIATGWYPLPQGERIASRLTFKRFGQLITWHSQIDAKVSGELESLENAVSSEGGCAIRVSTGSTSFLIDTGLPGYLQLKGSDCLILLSHFHLDHFGGITARLTGDLPVLMTRTTAQMLLALGYMSAASLKSRAIIVDFDSPVALGSDLVLSAFRVPHCPGSAGFQISDAKTALIFSGDLALRTARHDYLPTLKTIVSQANKGNRCVLLDATMAGRTLGASVINVAEDLLKRASPYTDIVIVSQDVEQLLYAYLDLFAHAKNHDFNRTTTMFLLSAKLRTVFRVLHSAYISRQLDQLDPFIAAQYGSSMSAWAESRWLYWLDTRKQLGHIPSGLRIWFVGADEARLVRPAGAAALVTVGRVRKEDLHGILSADTLAVDSTPWTLHSDEGSLANAVAELSTISKVILFHNFPKRLNKFATNRHLNCKVLSNVAMPLE